MKTPSASDANFAFRVYGRRKGKPLKPARARVFARTVPELRIVIPDGGAIAPETLFPKPCRALWVEIGFGGGEHLAATAAAHPDVGFIGCEVFINGVASLARHIDSGGLSNIRVFDDDARMLLAALPEGSVERIYVLFPDPWPKARHAKRRLIGPETNKLLARALADDGQLRIASDDPGYVRWALSHLTADPAFRWTAESPADWRELPADSVPTRYYQKALAAGRKPVFLDFARVPRRPPGGVKTPENAAFALILWALADI